MTYVIRLGGLSFDPRIYLQPDLVWGPYEKAKRFPSQEDADAFAKLNIRGNNYGVFPCGKPPRKRPSR